MSRKSLVPRWESPATKAARAEVRRLEFLLALKPKARADRERLENQLEEARAKVRGTA